MVEGAGPHSAGSPWRALPRGAELSSTLKSKLLLPIKTFFPLAPGTIGREELGAGGHHRNHRSVCFPALHLSPPDPLPTILCSPSEPTRTGPAGITFSFISCLAHPGGGETEINRQRYRRMDISTGSSHPPRDAHAQRSSQLRPSSVTSSVFRCLSLRVTIGGIDPSEPTSKLSLPAAGVCIQTAPRRVRASAAPKPPSSKSWPVSQPPSGLSNSPWLKRAAPAGLGAGMKSGRNSLSPTCSRSPSSQNVYSA